MTNPSSADVIAPVPASPNADAPAPGQPADDGAATPTSTSKKRAAKKKKPAVKVDPIAKEELDKVSSIFEDSLRQLKVLRSSTSAIRRLFEGKRYLYTLPWYLMMGMSGTGKTGALLNSGLKLSLASQRDSAAKLRASVALGTAHCTFWMTDAAVLIDTAGRYVTEDVNTAKDKAEWHGFMGLLRKYRKRTPINGVIVTLDVDALLTQTEPERLAYAAQLRARLLELRIALGIRFPVYVMVSKMDLLEG